MVQERIDHNSKIEGRFKSRLPTFAPEEIDEIRGKIERFSKTKSIVLLNSHNLLAWGGGHNDVAVV